MHLALRDACQVSFPPFEPGPHALSSSRILGSGEMADLVRAYDWGTTPLGPIEGWSPELLTIVNLTLASRSPARTMWGPDLILIYNDAYRPIPGPRHPWALGRPAKEVYGESWSVVGPLLERAMATGQTFFYEKLLVPLPTSTGIRDHYLNYSFNPIFENGAIAGLFGPLQDVTGEVTAVRELRESEARANRILESIGDAVIVTNADACIMRMNPIAERLTGWPIAEARGKPLPQVFRITSEATGQPVESPAEKVKRLGTIVGLANHTILTARDGTRTHIDDSGAPIRGDSGELLGIVLVFRDINERRAAERELQAASEALKASEEELRWTIKLSPQIPWTADPAGRITNFSESWLELTGLTREAAMGDGWTQVQHPEDLQRTVAAWTQAISTGEPYDVEHRIRTASGEHRWMRSSAQPRHDHSGAILKWYGTTEDIEDRKRAERALIQSEKLAAVGRLASSIAHEINNPLESVMNVIYLARQTATNEHTQQLLDTADQELRRVAVIANQTLRFHKQPSNPQAVSAENLFATVLSIYEGKLRKAGIRVEQRFSANEPVICFEGDIRQVLNNLVGNAIDAMPSGGRMLIRSRAATHWPSGRRGLVLTVADTGCGMSAETARSIFNPFFTTKGIAGTGLGLWVSQEIVARHRGLLTVRSAQGSQPCGTVFTLFLPFEAGLR